MEPNKPIDRWRYVVKQYWDTPHRRILFDVGTVSLRLMGADHAAQDIDRDYYALSNYLLSPTGAGAPAHADDYRRDFDRARQNYAAELAEGDAPYSGDEPLTLEEQRAELDSMFPSVEDYIKKRVAEEYPAVIERVDKALPLRNRSDFLVPWIARELGRINREIAKKRANEGDYWNARSALQTKAPAIAQWVEQEGIDIGRTSLAEALVAIRDFEAERGEPVPQGEVVYRFEDSWTIQMLSHAQLSDEGEVMQHCVGGSHYQDAVEHGETFIFSLRDPKGRPHVTIEWEPRERSSDAEGDALKDFLVGYVGQVDVPGRFVQILGKQNAEPLEKYRPYVQEFINRRFNGDRWGLLQVVMPDQRISFTGQVLHSLQDVGDWSEHADFRGAIFREVHLETGLNRMGFDGASFEECTFAGIGVEHCDFDGCRFVGCHFYSVTFDDSSFVGAVFVGADDEQRQRGGFEHDLDKVNFYECKLDESTWTRMRLVSVSFEAGSFRDVTFSSVDVVSTRFDGVDDVTGLTFAGDNTGGALRMHDIDLSEDVSSKSVQVLYDMSYPSGSTTNVKWPEEFDPDRGEWK